MKEQKEIKIVATNRRASFGYFLLSRHKAGMVLRGTEVKSIREGKVNLSDSYCYFHKGELWVTNVHIAEYRSGGFINHVPKSNRKLLLKKRELRRLEIQMKEKGVTIVPVEIFISERDLIKMTVAIAKGKHAYDKRDSIKDRDMKRDMDRAMRE